MASLCRTAIVPGLILICLGCTLGPAAVVRDGSLSEADESSRAGAAGAQHSPVTKAMAYQGRGESDFAQQTAGTSSGSPVDSFTSSVKNGFNKVGEVLTPETSVDKSADPTSLSNKATPSPELYVAMARLYEQQGKPDEAERQYQHALKLAPTSLEALLGMGRLRDRQGRLDEAIQCYQDAIKAHPREATALNDLGLCYARKGMYPDSLRSLQQAVQLQPTKRLFRNNIATVLVETGDNDAAFKHLVAVHGEAAACYNLGYLVYKKGQYELAAKLFAKALEKDPSLVQSRLWLEQTQKVLASRSTPGQGPTSVAKTPLPPQGVKPGEVLVGPPSDTAPVAQDTPPLLQARRPVAPSSAIRQLPPVSTPSKSAAEPALLPSGKAVAPQATPEPAILTAPLPPVLE